MSTSKSLSAFVTPAHATFPFLYHTLSAMPSRRPSMINSLFSSWIFLRAVKSFPSNLSSLMTSDLLNVITDLCKPSFQFRRGNMALEWSAGRKEEASITLPRWIEISCASFWKREDRIGRDNIATSLCSLFTIPWIPPAYFPVT